MTVLSLPFPPSFPISVHLLLFLLFSTSSSSWVQYNVSTYALDTEYSGPTFFDGFDFFTGSDPTNGFVSYQSHPSSLSKSLISTSNNVSHISVDFTTILHPDGRDGGRESVRISSKKRFTKGLFLADVRHMPGNVCGVWPAYWMFGPDWPNSGEIDIIEGVNLQQTNVMTLHSGSTCTITGLHSIGTLQSNDCNQNHGFGCSITSSHPTSYGDSFNTASGGVYATEWTSDYIRIWFFPRASIPTDIASGDQTPDPEAWGTPDANFEGECEIDSLFKEHQIVFDTTFCGDWAGGVWSSDPVCSKKADTCAEYVASKPEVFKDVYWDINYVKVFTLTDIPAPTSTSSKDISTYKSVSEPISVLTSTSESTSISRSTSTSTSKLSSATHFTTTSKPSTTPEPSSPTTSFPPFPTSPHNNTTPKPPKLQDWTYIGCLSSPTSNFLNFLLSTQNENMTIPLCASSCSSSAFLGTFSTLCYCGSELADTSTMSDPQCMTPCPGSLTQACGGPQPSSNSNTKSKRSLLENPLERRQSIGYLLTVYQNQALLPSAIAPSSSQPIVINPTHNRSKGLVSVSTLIGMPIGGSADPSTITSEVHYSSLPTGIDVRVGSATPSTSAKVDPKGTLIGIGKGGGLNLTTSGTEKAVGTTYTTILTTTYTDICRCAASTLKVYAITSTLTITHCGCNATRTAQAHPNSISLGTQTQHEIPMTTMTRICADCGMDGTVIVTVPCTEPTLQPHLPHPGPSRTEAYNNPSNNTEPSPATDTQNINAQMAGPLQSLSPIHEPQDTHVRIETVTVLPQPQRGNETVPFSNMAESMGLQWRWGLCALLGLAAVVVWAL